MSTPPPPPVPAPLPPAVPQTGDVPPPDYYPNPEERTMAMLTHLLPLVAGFIGPLIIWLIKREDSKFIDYNGKESLNFQITVFIVSMGLVISGMLIVLATMGFGMILVIPVAFGYGIFVMVVEIMAAMQSNRGEWPRYPLCIRFLK